MEFAVSDPATTWLYVGLGAFVAAVILSYRDGRKSGYKAGFTDAKTNRPDRYAPVPAPKRRRRS